MTEAKMPVLGLESKPLAAWKKTACPLSQNFAFSYDKEGAGGRGQ